MQRDQDTLFAPGNLFARDDTFFGVCEALGQDLGFHPNWLRLAFALALFANPLVTLAAYFAAGLAVALLRWAVPNPSSEVATGETALLGENDTEAVKLAA